MNHVNFFVKAFIRTGALLIALALMLAFAPRFETQFFPVVSDVAAYDWKEEGPGKWSAEIHMVKHRGCTPDEIWKQNYAGANRSEGKAAFITNPERPPPYEVPISYIDDDTPGSSHPAVKERQSFGRWSFGSVGRPVYPGNNLIFEPIHDCHPLFETQSPVGPIKVGSDTLN